MISPMELICGVIVFAMAVWNDDWLFENKKQHMHNNDKIHYFLLKSTTTSEV